MNLFQKKKDICVILLIDPAGSFAEEIESFS